MSEMSHVLRSLLVCATMWVSLYLCLVLLLTLPSTLMIHIFFTGAFLTAISYFRLPPPAPSASISFLGADPTNLDGTPSKRSTSAPLGVIAHRAAGSDAPENTISALRLAKKNGAKCVEFDVSFTSDGVAVVFHDDTVDRTTDGKGNVEDMTFEEIRKLNAAANHLFKDNYPDEKIPTVEEFVEECLLLKMKMIIDLKTWKSPEKTVALVTGLYASHPALYKEAMIGTFFPHLAYLIRQRDPDILVALTWRPYFLSYSNYLEGGSTLRRRFSTLHWHVLARLGDVILKWALNSWLWYFVGISAVLIHKDVLTREYLQMWRERGIRVIAWTVNNSLQRIYLTDFLRCSTMSDTMDQIPIEEFIDKKDLSGLEEEISISVNDQVEQKN